MSPPLPPRCHPFSSLFLPFIRGSLLVGASGGVIPFCGRGTQAHSLRRPLFPQFPYFPFVPFLFLADLPVCFFGDMCDCYIAFLIVSPLLRCTNWDIIPPYVDTKFVNRFFFFKYEEKNITDNNIPNTAGTISTIASPNNRVFLINNIPRLLTCRVKTRGLNRTGSGYLTRTELAREIVKNS